MNGRRILLRLILAATLAVWLAMSLWSMPHLETFGGGPILDLRFAGYGPAEAEALLQALGPPGRAFYLNAQQGFDWVFPALLCLTLILWSRRVAGGGLALVIGLIAVLAAAIDYAENLMVRRMLLTGSADGAEVASFLTMLKFAANAVVIAAALALSARALARWFRP